MKKLYLILTSTLLFLNCSQKKSIINNSKLEKYIYVYEGTGNPSYKNNYDSKLKVYKNSSGVIIPLRIYFVHDDSLKNDSYTDTFLIQKNKLHFIKNKIPVFLFDSSQTKPFQKGYFYGFNTYNDSQFHHCYFDKSWFLKGHHFYRFSLYDTYANNISHWYYFSFEYGFVKIVKYYQTYTAYYNLKKKISIHKSKKDTVEVDYNDYFNGIPIL